MKPPSPIADEEQRLAALKRLNILDTDPEERFDRLTRVALRTFNVPIALVTMVDENRQWFKSRQGLDVAQTLREISFCGHAIQGPEVFVVEDTLEDDRFADNPLVSGDPNIRFYAGAPLHNLHGHRIGTFCIIDRTERRFDAEDRQLLNDLASMAQHELDATQMAMIDELTGIANRRGFSMLAQQSLNLLMRQGHSGTLVFLDLDGFKDINDKYGHAEGDAALATFVKALQKNLRDSDVFARHGGDEFVVLLADTTAESAQLLIDRFRVSLDDINRQSTRGYKIEFSCGVVEFDRAKHRDIQHVLSDSDVQMYDRKRQKMQKKRAAPADS